MYLKEHIVGRLFPNVKKEVCPLGSPTRTRLHCFSQERNWVIYLYIFAPWMNGRVHCVLDLDRIIKTNACFLSCKTCVQNFQFSLILFPFNYCSLGICGKAKEVYYVQVIKLLMSLRSHSQFLRYREFLKSIYMYDGLNVVWHISTF